MESSPKLTIVLFICCFILSEGFRTQSFGSSSNLWRKRKTIGEVEYRSTSFYKKKSFHRAELQNNFRLFMAQQVDPYEGMDAYQILGVSRDADAKTIKAAFRKAVVKYHPDKVHNEPEKRVEYTKRMEHINRAWYCLQDPERKERYDRYGDAGVGSSSSAEDDMAANGGPGGLFGEADISDIFESMFSGGLGGSFGDFGGGIKMDFGGGRSAKRNPNAPVEGEDIHMEKEIAFMTSIFGGHEKVRILRSEECGTCSGSGVKPGAKVKTCRSCGGQGVVNQQQRTPFGMFNNVQTCSTCRGTGQEVDEYCGTCRGKGVTTETKELTLKVPKGVENGSTMRVAGGGNAGKRGGRRGDLFVQLTVRPDKRFTRDGSDIYSTQEISYIDAILGATKPAELVDGTLDLNIPAGTQPGQKLRVRGKGAHKLNSEARGDAFVTVKVNIPTKVSTQEKELLDQLAKLTAK